MSRLMDEFRKEAAKEAVKEIAANMLLDKLPVEKVAKYSGLSIEEVIALQKDFLIQKTAINTSHELSKSKSVAIQDDFVVTQEQKPKSESTKNENEDTNLIFYTPIDVARFLGCSMPTAYQVMHRKDFPLVKVGSHLRVYESAFKKWAMERRD